MEWSGGTVISFFYVCVLTMLTIILNTITLLYQNVFKLWKYKNCNCGDILDELCVEDVDVIDGMVRSGTHTCVESG